jgi:hypothetical protein
MSATASSQRSRPGSHTDLSAFSQLTLHAGGLTCESAREITPHSHTARMTISSAISLPFDPRGLNADIQVRSDRPTPYRSRLRWPDPVTGRRLSLSHSRDTAEQAEAWTALLVRAAEGGLDPRLVTEWLT